ncbi:MAG TPA: histidine kinase, partial [Flavipsychrobacter sp.]
MIWLLPLSALMAAGGHFIFLYYVYHIDITLAACDSVISVLTLSLSLWALGLAIKFYPTNVSVTLYSLLIAIFFSFSTVFASTALIRWWTETTDKDYLFFLEHSGPVRYIIYWLLCSWVSTYLSMSKRINTQEQKFKQQADATALLKEAELFKLRQQLQPHFLYNSLNSISALTMIEPGKAQEMIGLLSDFLRNSVQRETQHKVPLKDELDYLGKYLAIESVRFGDRLNVNVSNNAETEAHIPPFLLQPLIENAIKFGLYGNTGKVTIAVDIVIHDGML